MKSSFTAKNSAYKVQHPITMYMLNKIKVDQGRTARPSQQHNSKMLLRKDSKSNSTLSKPWKKDIRLSSHKRLITSINEQNQHLTNKLNHIANVLKFESDNNEIEQMMEETASIFSKIEEINTLYDIKSNEKQIDNSINIIISHFRKIITHISTKFLQSQQVLIQRYQQSIFVVGKQYDNLFLKLKNQQQCKDKLLIKINKIAKEFQLKHEKGVFLSQIISQLESNSINFEEWMLRSEALQEYLKNKPQFIQMMLRKKGLNVNEPHPPSDTEQYQNQFQERYLNDYSI